MNRLAKEIIIYSAAEQLAKDADFEGDSIVAYLNRSQEYYAGNFSLLTAEQQEAMRLQELLLLDDEPGALDAHPELKEEFTSSDTSQLKAATDHRNLDFYLRRGVNYTFDSVRVRNLRETLDMTRPLSGQLMRERIVSAEGLNNVRMNVVYHDMMDHLWAFAQLRAAGLDVRYADYMTDIGNPFTGFLFSKQAELLSGIGYNTRRFITDPEHHGSMGASRTAIHEHLAADAESDGRVADALARINDNESLAVAAGFVIVGAIGSLLLQRSRAGSVKKIVSGPEQEPYITGEPVKLLDPRYLSLMIDSVDALIARKEAYQELQLGLNLTIEALLRDCIETSSSSSRLMLGAQPDLSRVPDGVKMELENRSAISTSYYA